MDAQPTGRMSSSRPLRAAGIARFVLQVGWMSTGFFLLSLAGEWFMRSSGGLVSPIWPAAGFALAAALLYGIGPACLALYLGSLASNFLIGESPFFLYAGPVGSVFGLVLSWALLRKRVDLGFSSLREFGKFVVFGCFAGPALAGGFGAALLDLGPKQIPVSQALMGGESFFLASAFGVLVFCPFFVFVLRRQDFRPPTVAGRFELMGYMLLLSGLLFPLVHVEGIGLGLRLAALGLCFVLSLVVALRFGLRITEMFQALSIFLVPTFAAMVPGRLEHVRVLASGDDLQPLLHLFALLASLGCLLAAAFRDEMDALRLKFALALSSANLCVWDWSAAGWTCHTPEWREKLGMGLRKTISEDVLREMVHPEDLPDFERNFQYLSASEILHWSQNCRMRNSEGGWISVQIEARPLRRTADDAVASVAGVMRETTAEQEIVQNRIKAIETEAQLRTLRTQINPHFLFNALNSIRALVGRQDAKAKSMITSLSILLREVLAGRDTKLQSVEKELEVVRTYLEIEAIRFGERIRYRLDCSPDLLGQRIPGMLILTLVENSVKHGVSKLEKGGSIEVLVRRSPDDASILVFVVNDGILKMESPTVGGYGGLGLENVRERITLSTDGRGSFEIHDIPGPRVEAIALLPLDRRCLPPARGHQRSTDAPPA